MEHGLVRQLLEASPDALWVMRVDGSTVYGNDNLAALLGRDVDTLDAETIFGVADDQGRRDLVDHLALMSQGHPGRDNDEVLLVRPDGSRVWTLVSWRPMRDADGELIGYLHRLTEYTERRELLDRLRTREKELASAQTIAHLGSWSLDVLDQRCTWSPELYRIFGVEAGSFTPDFAGYVASTHPDDRRRVESLIRETMREGDSYSFESRIVRPDGEVRWISASGVVERDHHGAATVVHGTCQDVTELHGAANDADDARLHLMLFSRIAEAANRSVNLDDALNRAGEALRSVDGWRTLAVWSRPEPRDTPVLTHDLSRPGVALPTPDEVARVASWSTGQLSVEPAPSTGGSVAWLPVRLAGRTVRLIQLTGDTGDVDEAVRVLLDQVSGALSRVAEREQTAAELAAARDEAMEASAHKSAFLATMSHEIRTPMNGVIGLNDLLLRTELDAHQRRLAEGLRGAGLTLLALINDILDLSKIESGAVELERAPFEVAQVLDQAATIITAPAQEKRLELVLSIDPEVPRFLVGDAVRLGQVLTNLASNAVKFTDHGEVVVELGLGPCDEPGRVLLRGEVRDTGIGVGPEVAGLFEAFTQADRSTTRTHGGTGLGLTISRRLVHDMGGSIGAEQRPERGSVFWFEVPLDVATRTPGTAALPRLEHRRALVVDDNDRAAAALSRQLAAWGLEVHSVDSAGSALGALMEAADAGNTYDLALVDLHMPDVDGLALGRAIRTRPELSDLPMILLSDDPSSRPEDVADLGFSSVVDKPLRPVELHGAILGATLDTGGLLVAARATRVDDPHREQPTLSVLVVEDNPVNQLVAQGLLDSLGYRSSVAANGEEAVAALAPGHSFDLVLMDCRMPRMDGYVATALIRARESGTRVPIIAVTASALAGERDRCLAAGMDDFLTKPVDPVSLTRLLERWTPSTAASASAGDPERPGSGGDGEADPVLDPERIEMLSELVRDGVNYFERTRTSFLSRIDETLATLRTARDERDLGLVRSIAHQLKGSTLNLGLNRAGAAASALEQAATEGDPSATIPAITALEQALGEGVRALDAFAVGGQRD